MPTTQSDVARRAGVSQRTVSNVVNGLSSVGPEVRERVMDAIRDLGYRPSLAARGLRVGRSGLLQLVIPELDVPYFSELARHIVAAAEERGYALLIRQTLGSIERERAALDDSAGEYVEGTILSAVGPVGDVLSTRRTRPPVVLIGEGTEERLVDHVGIDDEAAAFLATERLLATGRRRVAFIGADPTSSLRMAALRRAGYGRALAVAGVAVDEELVVATSSYHRADGAAAMARLLDLESPPDAVFAATDLLALGALHCAAERAVHVPEDVAVVGFDGIEEGKYSTPTLSTIAPDTAAIARRSVDALIDRIAAAGATDDRPPADIRVPFAFVERRSTPHPTR
jgi:LacI family repressor for deo operon, udp, cdd, tsx, nupC, and nupG